MLVIMPQKAKVFFRYYGLIQRKLAYEHTLQGV